MTTLYRVTVYPHRPGVPREIEERAPCSVAALIRCLQKLYPDEGPADGLTVHVRPAAPHDEERRECAPGSSGTAAQEEVVGC